MSKLWLQTEVIERGIGAQRCDAFKALDGSIHGSAGAAEQSSAEHLRSALLKCFREALFDTAQDIGGRPASEWREAGPGTQDAFVELVFCAWPKLEEIVVSLLEGQK